MSATWSSLNFKKGFTKTISVSSGKGGVGKTTMVSNLALALSQMGRRVLILDGDFGMANVDIMYGVKTLASIEQVFKGRLSLEEIITPVAPGVDLIPGGSGIYELQNVDVFQRKILLDQVSALENSYDYLLVDTAPGIAENVLYLNSAVQEILVILTPDPSSLADAYALMKVLNVQRKENKFSVICNNVRDEQEGQRIFKRLADVAAQFLCVSLEYRGSVPSDPEIRRATRTQNLVLQANPRSPASLAIKLLAQKLDSHTVSGQIKGGMQFFWEQLVGVA